MNQSEGQTTHTHTQLPLTVSLVTREEQEEPKKIIYVRALVRYTHDVHEQKTIAVTRIHTHTCRDRQNHPPPFVCLMCRFSVFFFVPDLPLPPPRQRPPIAPSSCLLSFLVFSLKSSLVSVGPLRLPHTLLPAVRLLSEW